MARGYLFVPPVCTLTQSHMQGFACSKLQRLVNFALYFPGFSFVINVLTMLVTWTEYLGQSALHTVTGESGDILGTVVGAAGRA